jgi:hypothetical protein
MLPSVSEEYVYSSVVISNTVYLRLKEQSHQILDYILGSGNLN